jgi:hypothetical protein
MELFEAQEKKWKQIYLIGGIAAVGTVLIGLLEIMITFMPGGSASQETVLEWFSLYQENLFLGLRNMGLLNLGFNTFAILAFFALYAVHRRNPYLPYAALALIIAIIGITVFFANNRAFPLLDLSNQYTAAPTAEARTSLIAAAKSMLVVGQSHVPGTFLGFALIELAAILVSLVMLGSGLFHKATGYIGILGFSLLLVFEFFSSFFTGLSDSMMAFAILSGLLTMIWYILVGTRLIKLARASGVADPLLDP